MTDLFEGDIEVDDFSEDDNIPGNENAAIKFRHYHWPEGIVPYVISSDFSAVETTFIETVMLEFHFFTCVRFRRRQDEEDYIHIVAPIQRHCTSYIGRQGRRQDVRLNKIHCLNRNTILHELMHVLGFVHEHSRYDRDTYVEILEENIYPYARKYFKKASQDTVTHLNTPYDFESVMHYPKMAYSKNGKDTIRPKGATIQIESNGLSEIDKVRINRLYNCSILSSTTTRKLSSTTKRIPITKRPPITTTTRRITTRRTTSKHIELKINEIDYKRIIVHL